MNECGGLKRLARKFSRHLGCGNSAQFIVNEWQQFRCELLLSALHAVQYLGDFSHAPLIYTMRRRYQPA
jgi:hypothetical protein